MRITPTELARLHIDPDSPVMVSNDGGKSYHVLRGYEGKTMRDLFSDIKRDAHENCDPETFPEWLDRISNEPTVLESICDGQ
jgi:hypothetical protein